METEKYETILPEEIKADIHYQGELAWISEDQYGILLDGKVLKLEELPELLQKFEGYKFNFTISDS